MFPAVCLLILTRAAPSPSGLLLRNSLSRTRSARGLPRAERGTHPTRFLFTATLSAF